jgi:hypothetical protein
MNAERRRALEKELQDILKITNPLVPATLDPNSPTPMSVPEVESEELDRLRKRRDEIQLMLDKDSSEEGMRAKSCNESAPTPSSPV